jgi:hypothetical protein
MSTLIDHLATERVVGRSLVLAYSVGLVAGIALAVAALVAVSG